MPAVAPETAETSRTDSEKSAARQVWQSGQTRRWSRNQSYSMICIVTSPHRPDTDTTQSTQSTRLDSAVEAHVASSARRQGRDHTERSGVPACVSRREAEPPAAPLIAARTVVHSATPARHDDDVEDLHTFAHSTPLNCGPIAPVADLLQFSTPRRAAREHVLCSNDVHNPEAQFARSAPRPLVDAEAEAEAVADTGHTLGLRPVR